MSNAQVTRTYVNGCCWVDSGELAKLREGKRPEGIATYSGRSSDLPRRKVSNIFDEGETEKVTIVASSEYQYGQGHAKGSRTHGMDLHVMIS